MIEAEATLLTLRWGPRDLSQFQRFEQQRLEETTAIPATTTTTTTTATATATTATDTATAPPVLLLLLVLLPLLRPAYARTYDRDDQHDKEYYCG